MLSYCEHITNQTLDYYRLSRSGLTILLCETCWRDLLASVTHVYTTRLNIQKPVDAVDTTTTAEKESYV